jgi:D-glycero-D-manno-heptose 1,7-bisphosphate phosphatase
MSKTPKIIILIGFPASTKSSLAREIETNNPDAIILSRDVKGETVDSLIPLAEKHLLDGKTVIIDNTNLTKQIRKKFIDIAKKHNTQIEARYINTTIEDCQIRHLKRMYEKFGQIYQTGNPTQPNAHPPVVYFKAKKELELPTKEEGFKHIICIEPPPITWDKKYKNRALFIDLDGTIRDTVHLPYKYPTHPDEVQLLKPKDKIRTKLDSYRSKGYFLIGLTNQSGISRGTLTEPMLDKILDRTRELLGYTHEEFPILYCPHHPAPIKCYCRKPQSGMPMECIMKLHINPHKSIMVGDMKSDEELAERLGMQYIDVNDFWRD